MSRRRSTTLRAAAAALALSALAAACGDDADDAAPVGEAEPAAADERDETPEGDAGADEAACSALAGLDGAGSAPVAGMRDAAADAGEELAAAVAAVVEAIEAGDRSAATTAAEAVVEHCRPHGDAVDAAALVAADAWALPGGEVQPTYTCAGADPSSTALLQVMADGPLEFTPTLRMEPVHPSPAAGDAFTGTFTGEVELSGDIVTSIVTVGITEVTIEQLSVAIAAGAGLAEAQHTAEEPPATVGLESGQPVALTVGPFEVPFVRTAAAGEPVAFSPGALDLTVATELAGAPVRLAVTCEPAAGTELTMTDAVPVS